MHLFLIFSTIQKGLNYFLQIKDAGVNVSPYIAIIILGFVRQIGSLLGAILLNKFPRKQIMIISAIIMGIALLALGKKFP